MKNCKNYKIYKFNYAISGNTDYMNRKRWIRANELTDFKIKLIDKFSCMSYQEWVSNHFLRSFEKSFEYFESIGFQIETQWSSLYMGVPKDRTDIIEFIDNNSPNWTKVVKKI